MNFIKLIFGIVFLFAVTGVTAKQNKMLICHVGNETGPGGETYLDDPDCEPNDLNAYFCPDAGKIDLIVIAEKAALKHLANPSHYWDGISDYDPFTIGASGEGTEDSDGNGVDDGCEPTGVCPCWDEIELQGITADNYYASLSCSSVNSIFPFLAALTEFPVQSFTAAYYEDTDSYECQRNGVDAIISMEQYDFCFKQIAKRCAEIGDPINSE